MQILVTGGAGYVGNVIVHKLMKIGYDVIVIDTMELGHYKLLPKNVKLYIGNINDYNLLNSIFGDHNITHVIHCAAYTCVGESMSDPIKYFENNIGNIIPLLKIMEKYKCKNIIFSSSCATYGNPTDLPMNESHLQNPINVYGYTKLVVEQMLDYMIGWNVVILRYFNVAGAYIDGDLLIGEDHNPETHLIPLAIKALLDAKSFNIYGNNYETRDGTCVRDFIHVEDLADAHIMALGKSGKYNLGSEKGYTVREILDMIEIIAGKTFMINVCERREGDPAELYADSSKIKSELGWVMKHDIQSIVKSAYLWHNK
jgi:UDP-glucose 4-epimerase